MVVDYRALELEQHPPLQRRIQYLCLDSFTNGHFLGLKSVRAVHTVFRDAGREHLTPFFFLLLFLLP